MSAALDQVRSYAFGKKTHHPSGRFAGSAGFAFLESALMRCVCGITFDSDKPAESYDHRAHIYAAQARQGR
jgi:hypothetical protein